MARVVGVRISRGGSLRESDSVCAPETVRDNGQGIDPEYHDKVFELFERLDLETDGTGIGLALVKRIVEVHGGRVWVESDGPGCGSTFCFTLPVAGREDRAPGLI